MNLSLDLSVTPGQLQGSEHGVVAAREAAKWASDVVFADCSQVGPSPRIAFTDHASELASDSGASRDFRITVREFLQVVVRFRRLLKQQPNSLSWRAGDLRFARN